MPDQPYRLSPRLYDALQLTFKLHGRDARKATRVPVLSHLLSVCALVQFDGGDEDEAIAALLHDALEDKPEEISREQIRRRFGERVLAMVNLCTDTPLNYQGGPKPAWLERKKGYLERIRREDPALMRATVADKIDNARAMLAEYRRVGDQLWSKFKAGRAEQVWYFKQAVDAYGQAGFISPLLDDLRDLVEQLDALPGRP